ncbi:hypothetical protein T12_664, partial [Trichinella patagoniensis]
LLLVRESKRPRAMIVGMQKLPMMIGDIFSSCNDEIFLYSSRCVFATEYIITCSANGSQAVIQKRTLAKNCTFSKLTEAFELMPQLRNYHGINYFLVTMRNVDTNDVIEIFEKFKLSREEVEQWLANDDISLFEPLSDDEIFETMEKDENEDA